MSMFKHIVLKTLYVGKHYEILLLRSNFSNANNQTVVGKLVKKLPENILHIEALRNEKCIFEKVQGGPFIIKHFSLLEDEEKMLLVVEHLPINDLSVLCDKNKMTQADVKFFVCEILLGIEHLHKSGVIHKDLKPENIGIDKYGHIGIFDFGLSEFFGPSVRTPFFRNGTDRYMAPEVRNLKVTGYDESLDWWGFGVMLHFLLVKDYPVFEDPDNQDKLVNPLSHSMVTEEAADLIKKLLKKNPKSRLGGGGRGAKEIKRHPYFSGVDWKQVKAREETPPTWCTKALERGKYLF